jgi:hypothetical protein
MQAAQPVASEREQRLLRRQAVADQQIQLKSSGRGVVLNMAARQSPVLAAQRRTRGRTLGAAALPEGASKRSGVPTELASTQQLVEGHLAQQEPHLQLAEGGPDQPAQHLQGRVGLGQEAANQMLADVGVNLHAINQALVGAGADQQALNLLLAGGGPVQQAPDQLSAEVGDGGHSSCQARALAVALALLPFSLSVLQQRGQLVDRLNEENRVLFEYAMEVRDSLVCS